MTSRAELDPPEDDDPALRMSELNLDDFLYDEVDFLDFEEEELPAAYGAW